MKKLLSLLLFVSLTCFAKAQSVDTVMCDAPDRDTTEFENLPWFGNNIYLENFLDSIGYPSGMTDGIVGPDRVRFHVPIKFWVYRNSAGIGGPTLRQLRDYIDNLNKYYNVDNNTLIGFYMRCEIGYIDDDAHLDIGYDNEANSLLQDYKERGCINIHIVNSLQGTTIGVQIRARFFGIDGIFLDRSTYTNPDLGNTIAHEVGHYFELDHTHQYFDKGKCRREAIDRNRTYPFFNFCFTGLFSNKICESTGDGLSDTQADPNLSNNNSCNYLLGGNDLWGDSYSNPPHGVSERPNTQNIMSYNGTRTCIDIFSRLQIAVMLHSIYRGKSINNRDAWKDLRAEYDDYEMDNFSQTARPIIINEIEEHNFNQQYYGDDIWGQCDVDWVSFIPTCSSGYDIQTLENIGSTKANTRLTLFDANLNQLAQNDDISTTNQFSKINYALVAGQTYFFRIENLSPNTTGYYNLKVAPGFTMSGNPALCTYSTYSVNNLPTGAGVTWSASPSGVVSFNPSTGSSTTITRVYDGDVTIIATVTNACSSPSVIVTKEISAGLPYVYSTYNYNGSQNTIHLWQSDQYYNPVCNSASTTITANIQGATSVTWSKIASSPTNITWTPSGNNLNFYFYNLNQTAVFQISASNTCGTTAQQYGFKSVTCGGGGGGCLQFAISPNPAQGTLKVIVPDIPAPCDGPTPNNSVNKSSLGITQIKVYDQSGTLKAQKTYSKSKQASLDVSSLKAGVYFVDISDGTTSERQQVIIQN